MLTKRILLTRTQKLKGTSLATFNKESAISVVKKITKRIHETKIKHGDADVLLDTGEFEVE